MRSIASPPRSHAVSRWNMARDSGGVGNSPVSAIGRSARSPSACAPGRPNSRSWRGLSSLTTNRCALRSSSTPSPRAFWSASHASSSAGSSSTVRGKTWTRVSRGLVEDQHRAGHLTQHEHPAGGVGVDPLPLGALCGPQARTGHQRLEITPLEPARTSQRQITDENVVALVTDSKQLAGPAVSGRPFADPRDLAQIQVPHLDDLKLSSHVLGMPTGPPPQPRPPPSLPHWRCWTQPLVL